MSKIEFYPMNDDNEYYMRVQQMGMLHWYNSFGYKLVKFITRNDTIIGLISYTTILGNVSKTKASIQLNMLELLPQYRKQGISVEILYHLMQHYDAQVIYGQVMSNSISYLEKIGATVKVLQRDKLRMNHEDVLVPYTLNKRKLQQYIDRADLQVANKQKNEDLYVYV